MNNVSLIGRLTRDPELHQTQTGVSFVKFTIAVDRPYSSKNEEKEADFINISAWRGTAEFIKKYFEKGQRIALTGSIRTGSYTGQDGTKKYTFEVLAQNVEFCEYKNARPKTEPYVNNSSSADDKGKNSSNLIADYNNDIFVDFDNDLPF